MSFACYFFVQKQKGLIKWNTKKFTPEQLELQISQTNTGLFISYGAYSREVSFEEIGQAYLNYFSVEEVDSNFITSVYGRNNFPEFFRRVVESDNLLYCNRKSQDMFERWGEQYSELTNNLSFDIIIHQSCNIVNDIPEDITGNLDNTTPEPPRDDFDENEEQTSTFK